ncbi:MAG: hypothetical protein A2Y64_04845 [Candidatus Coatesbacteria bacterium RBG_13_66_14]|uniref:Uncharacterized protein n=1 Tax=Candidatus Coatesbacteria bacterium RBG_13_66_14 TaxID=1817816 RepID=A0A1F5FGW2_9BACT|nr:MAG: hypothetical protein A2Y64_04845 [Candidatus Coatesbacteria bacterium RBG_13_66_14]
MFVSTSLLRKTKRYLSPSQREAVDLYVCTKLFEREKPSILGVFLDEYLHPKTENPKSKTSVLLDDFTIIDRGGLFFSLFLQELGYLGEKVFGRRRDDLINTEVNDLIGFLKPIASRRIGDESDLNFKRVYCRLGIVIIGKPSVLLVSLHPYVTYIRYQLVNQNIETIYILSRAENHEKIDKICEEFSRDYEYVRRLRFTRYLEYSDRRERTQQYLAVLRRRGVGVFQPSAA